MKYLIGLVVLLNACALPPCKGHRLDRFDNSCDIGKVQEK
jgi:hypothetical protein